MWKHGQTCSLKVLQVATEKGKILPAKQKIFNHDPSEKMETDYIKSLNL